MIHKGACTFFWGRQTRGMVRLQYISWYRWDEVCAYSWALRTQTFADVQAWVGCLMLLVRLVCRRGRDINLKREKHLVKRERERARTTNNRTKRETSETDIMFAYVCNMAQDIRRQNHAKPINALPVLASANPGACFRTWRPLRYIALLYYIIIVYLVSKMQHKLQQAMSMLRGGPYLTMSWMCQDGAVDVTQPCSTNWAWPKCFDCLDFRLSQEPSQMSGVFRSRTTDEL